MKSYFPIKLMMAGPKNQPGKCISYTIPINFGGEPLAEPKSGLGGLLDRIGRAGATINYSKITDAEKLSRAKGDAMAHGIEIEVTESCCGGTIFVSAQKGKITETVKRFAEFVADCVEADNSRFL